MDCYFKRDSTHCNDDTDIRFLNRTEWIAILKEVPVKEWSAILGGIHSA